MVDIMRIRVDTNDADFKTYKIKINCEDIEHIRKVSEIFSTLDIEHNYPTGSKYGYSMGEIYKKEKLLELDFFITFDKYIGRKTFHTIHLIEINNEILFLSNHWSNWKVKKYKPLLIDKPILDRYLKLYKISDLMCV